MNVVNEIMKSASLLGACTQSNGVSDWKSLSWLFFSSQGREFCEKNSFPSLGMFRDMKNNVSEFGVFVDSGDIECSNETNIALIGNISAELTYSGAKCVHKIILMHGATAHIKASGYAVLLMVNIGGCEVEIEKDDTVVML